MSLAQAFLLATVQGLSEFLPISSSGHLALIHHVLHIKESPTLFVILVHTGTLLAVLAFFSKKFSQLLKGSASELIIKVLVASLPAIIAGLVIVPFLNQMLTSPKMISLGFTITSLFLFLSRHPQNKRIDIAHLSLSKSLLVGFFQAVALIPGLSRSATTLWAGQKQGLDPTNSLLFSFLLFIPASLGALTLTLVQSKLIILSPTEILIGLIVPFVTGYLSLSVLEKILQRDRLYLFFPYCLALAVFSLAI